MLKSLKGKVFHFIGIGGISMSALALNLRRDGFAVQGSDAALNHEVRLLEKRGIKVFLGHKKENLCGADVVVYSSAIHEDNAELAEARRLGLLVLRRAELLGAIADGYKTVIAVAGSHGKTTTTAMIAEIFMAAGAKPTIHIGGVLKKINSNYLAGNKKYFITEACEYKDNFLFIRPDIAVILNIDSDHLDYFKDLDGVKRSFIKFSSGVREGGICLCSADDKNSKKLLSAENIGTFGIKKKCDIYAQNIREYKPGYYSFEVVFCENSLGEIKLNIFGRHNIYNALAAIYVALICGIDFCDARAALENFCGTTRRSEPIGEINGARVFHDYAHHPAQILEMLKVARRLTGAGGRVIAVFEPHTYSRTQFLLKEFAESFALADHLILAPVYSAREDASEGKNSQELLEECLPHVKSAECIDTYAEILKRLKVLAKPGDTVMILGAGSIENLAEMIKNEAKKTRKNTAN